VVKESTAPNSQLPAHLPTRGLKDVRTCCTASRESKLPRWVQPTVKGHGGPTLNAANVDEGRSPIRWRASEPGGRTSRGRSPKRPRDEVGVGQGTSPVDE